MLLGKSYYLCCLIAFYNYKLYILYTSCVNIKNVKIGLRVQYDLLVRKIIKGSTPSPTRLLKPYA